MRYFTILGQVSVHSDIGFGSTHLSQSDDDEYFDWAIIKRYEMPDMTSMLCLRGELSWTEVISYRDHGIICRNKIFGDCHLYDWVNGGTSGDLG
jgi:hypothetical protein